MKSILKIWRTPFHCKWTILCNWKFPWFLKVLHGTFICQTWNQNSTLEVGRRESGRLTRAVGSGTPTSYSTNATAVCLFAPMSRLCDTPLCCACLNCPTQLELISDSVRMSKHGVSNPSLCPPWRLAAHENPPKSTTPANRQRMPNTSRFLSKQVPVKRQINDKSFEGVCWGNDFAHVSPLKNWLGPAWSKYLNQ